jgi:stearoyl-CoA desaturase (delta-9 desaturase)
MRDRGRKLLERLIVSPTLGSDNVHMVAEMPTLSVARLKPPAGTQPRRVSWVDVAGLAFCHLVACLAFVPWLFSWAGLVVAIAGLYVFGTLGIGLCFHRLLTHRGMVCPKPLEHAFAVLGVCCLQDTPARWVATHRWHHMHADEQPDPHSPLVNFLWAHVGWLIFKNRDLTRLSVCTRYAKDILRDPFYARLERKQVWVAIVLGSWATFFAIGFLIELLIGGSFVIALRFGLSLLIWGAFVRTVLVWHSTWAVNSVAHAWGYRSYDTAESSRNNVILALLSSGEGWHNNHHAFPRSARHGHLWWELDVTWLTIRLLAWLGLARCLVLPRGKRLDSDGQ